MVKKEILSDGKQPHPVVVVVMTSNAISIFLYFKLASHQAYAFSLFCDWKMKMKLIVRIAKSRY